MIILVGKSGSGKSSIENILVNNYSMNKAISYTSRSMRDKEQEGFDYFFRTREEILNLY